jgi:pyrimidine deaminase RibD-like protein
MAGVRSANFLPGQFHLLARAFERATATLTDAESTPSVKACLADKVLAVVAAGHCEPARVSEAALAAMRDCLLDCTGCQPASPSLLAAAALPWHAGPDAVSH